ncbi:ras gtpase-activating protein [Anaeramoeba ignava]|uniref:Ras gtpase-activating protein n=1 Tax=Anaeramoeba ignava TaxID=1746090 RepID=A0A9Q0R9V6_ANAIG|nr:ras gtpase-activating protein [Anaeramoeba ignava]
MSSVPQLFVKVFEVKKIPKFEQPSLIYCKIKQGKYKLQTTFKDSTNPKWNEDFIFLAKKDTPLLIELIQLEKLTKKSKIFGKITISLKSIKNEKPVEKIYEVIGKKNSIVGKMKLLIHYLDIKKELGESQKKLELWKSKFIEFLQLITNDSFEILSILVDVISSREYKNFAENMVAILYPQKLILPFIKIAIEKEVSNSNSPDQLFRANSFATKIIKEFSLQIGKDFLHLILKEPIEKIMNIKEVVDILPENHTNIETLDEAYEIIENCTNDMLNSILSAQKKIPIDLLEICRYIRQSVQLKFPEKSLVAVSGFIFLRFFGPSIVSPEDWNSNISNITPTQRKNIVLVGKIVQTLANHADLGVKDEKLKPLTFAFKNRIEDIDKFLDQISQDPNQEIEKDLEIQIQEKFFDLNQMGNLVKFLKLYKDKIETIFSTEENIEFTKEENFKNKTLESRDKITKMEDLLNILGDPCDSHIQKLHSISSPLIQGKKAIKIVDTQQPSFVTESEDTFGILNINSSSFGEKKSPITISIEICGEINELYYKYLFEKQNPDSQLNHKRDHLFYANCNWKRMREDDKYIELMKSKIGELKSINLADINQLDRIPFWINIHNALFINACVENGTPPLTLSQAKHFSSLFKYKIDDFLFSIDDITQGILRANAKNFFGIRHFRKTDPRRDFVLDFFFPLILFGISNLQIASPPVHIYHEKIIEKELYRSAQLFIENFIQIEDRTLDPLIILPKFFKYFHSDFGKSDDQMVEFIEEILQVTQSDIYMKFRNILILDFSLKYINLYKIPEYREYGLFDSKTAKIFKSVPNKYTQKLSWKKGRMQKMRLESYHEIDPDRKIKPNPSTKSISDQTTLMGKSIQMTSLTPFIRSKRRTQSNPQKLNLQRSKTQVQNSQKKRAYSSLETSNI